MSPRPAASAGRGGWQVASVAGIPVFVSPSWLLIAVVLVVLYAPLVADRVPGLAVTGSYAAAALFVLLLFASVLLHELGHALTARSLGVDVRAMTLWMLGGYTEMRTEPRSAGGEFAVSAAGPLVSLALGGAGYLATGVLAEHTLGHEVAVQVMLSNLTIAAFNALPGLPLDGGALLRALVWKVSGDRLRGTVVAAWAGRVIAVALFATGLYLGVRDGAAGVGSMSTVLTLTVAVFLFFAATQALRAARVAGRVPRLHAGALARPCVSVPAQTPLAEALRRALDAGAEAIVVVDAAARPVGVVARRAVDATPEHRRPWIVVAHVATTVTPGMILPAELAGMPMVRAMRSHPATEYLVADGDRIVGVVSSADIAAVLGG